MAETPCSSGLLNPLAFLQEMDPEPSSSASPPALGPLATAPPEPPALTAEEVNRAQLDALLTQGVERLTPDQWHRERGKLIGYAIAHLNASPEEAEDLVQEAVIRLFRLDTKPDFSGGAFCFRSWFRVTMKRLWVDQKRAQQVRYKHALGVTSSMEIRFQAQQPRPDENLFLDRFRLLARQRMSAQEWAVFEQVVLEGNSFQEFLSSHREARTTAVTWRDALRRSRQVALMVYAEVAGREAEPYLLKLGRLDSSAAPGAYPEEVVDILGVFGAEF